MAVDFSRTTRALAADGYRLVLIGLALAMLLLLAWTLWFFRAEIRFYETSRMAEFIGDGAIRAEFPLDLAGRIRFRQPALFLPDTVPPGVPDTVPVLVTEIQRTPDDLQVILVIPSHEAPGLLLNPGDTGRVQLETERLTPARWVLRLAGGGDPDRR